MTTVLIQCANCLLFNNESTYEDRCAAFPDGIPDEIISGEHDHRREFGGERTNEFGRPLLLTPIDKDLVSTEPIEPLPSRRKIPKKTINKMGIQPGDVSVYNEAGEKEVIR
tara:strand:+ start:9004 stop:9336 length:333 start_codon:yes stop_codon:yes gene_type:complete